MAARTPNNLPWIILGTVCGLAVLGLFGLGVYTGAKSVSDEMGVTVSDPPETVATPEIRNTFTIFVDETNKISLDGTALEDVGALRTELASLDFHSPESTHFILRLSEDSSHTSLIAINDMLDDLEFRSVIEIVRRDAE